ncbi:hypothetical protein SPF06_04590 [Sinomonas sp. JGH33]|uniref:Nucleotide exchange factor GrpE n=1 Tax=Sinomonas terricola TaxID=3110330 RepID=A0ABU5T353_9MICC|nr:hypothetical protein [Sinomonas sp. JGH33]MEA5453995.1 hypothetical protein [Sinomonas sp. JGH33]
MSEPRETAPEPADDVPVEYPAEQEASGPGDSGDEANALRFTEEEQLIHEQIRRHREERERRERLERERQQRG